MGKGEKGFLNYLISLNNRKKSIVIGKKFRSDISNDYLLLSISLMMFLVQLHLDWISND